MHITINLFSTVYLHFLTVLQWGIVAGELYELEIAFDWLGNGEWCTVKRIAYLRTQKKFHLWNVAKVNCAYASKQFLFNALGQRGYVCQCQLKSIRRYIEALDASNPIPNSTEIRVALVEQYEQFRAGNKVSTLSHYFSQNRLLYLDDIISVRERFDLVTEKKLYYKIVGIFVHDASNKCHSQNTTTGVQIAYANSKMTNCYEVSSINGVRFPRQRINWSRQFVPSGVRRATKEMSEILTRSFYALRNCHNQVGDGGENKDLALNSPLIAIPICALTFSSEGCENLLIDCIGDELCVNIHEVNCLNFTATISGVSMQTKAGRKTLEEKIRDTIKTARSFAPCIIWLNNFLASFGEIALNEGDGENSRLTLEAIIKAINGLHTSIKEENNDDSSSEIGIILTCKTTDVLEMPSEITHLTHFEYQIGDLTLEDRQRFFHFKVRSSLNWYSKSDEQWFLNSTKGFTWSELNQLLSNAVENSLVRAYKAKCKNWKNAVVNHKDFQHSIENHRKAFSKDVGVPTIPVVTWEDVGGLDSVKQLITESLQMNSHIDSMGNSSWRRSGILLYGPPGCGKTLIAKAVANEFKMTFLSVKGPELLNQYVGQSEKNLRDVFAKARAAAPSILFFDELDSLATNRGSTGDSGGVMDRMVSQLMTELDQVQYNPMNSIFVMAATNRLDLIDSSLLSPGRFDKTIFISPAKDVESKLRILRPICQHLNLHPELSIEKIAAMCPEEISGAELHGIMSKAAMNSLREIIQQMETEQSLFDADNDHNNLEVVEAGDLQALKLKEKVVVIHRKHIEMALQEVMNFFKKELSIL